MQEVFKMLLVKLKDPRPKTQDPGLRTVEGSWYGAYNVLQTGIICDFMATPQWELQSIMKPMGQVRAEVFIVMGFIVMF